MTFTIDVVIVSEEPMCNMLRKHMSDNIVWPIDYTVRKSGRAKRVSLRIDAQGLVEVVVPKRMLFFDVNQFVEQSKQWIIAKINELSLQPANAIEIPNELPLLAIDQTWKIIHQPSVEKTTKILSKHFLELILSGDLNNQVACRITIKKWLQRQAKKILPAWFDDISQRVNLPYNSLRINTAKTRWGSCSTHKNISLNAKLLLLPKDMVEHVMLHELCHTVHLDHSREFWSLLTSFDPNTPERRKILRQYHTPLTQWLDL